MELGASCPLGSLAARTACPALSPALAATRRAWFSAGKEPHSLPDGPGLPLDLWLNPRALCKREFSQRCPSSGSTSVSQQLADTEPHSRLLPGPSEETQGPSARLQGTFPTLTTSLPGVTPALILGENPTSQESPAVSTKPLALHPILQRPSPGDYAKNEIEFYKSRYYAPIFTACYRGT